MEKQKKQHNGLKCVAILGLFLGLTGARSLPVEPPSDAPFRIKKVYEPKKRSPASFKQEVIPAVTPVPEPDKNDKSQFPWLFRFSRKSTR